MALTPMMTQYFEVKDSCKDAILFFRLGDFYEMFFDDAKTASRELELVLTGRDCGLSERAPMCGIPFHSSTSYINKLVSRGYKVAICEQLEEAGATKSIVKRGVVKIYTPGTLSDTSFLDEKKNNYLMSLFIKDSEASVSFCDISTGDFFTTEFSFDKMVLLNEISKYSPKEIIISGIDEELKREISDRSAITFTEKEDCFFDSLSEEELKGRFKEINFDNISKIMRVSISSLLKYIMETQKAQLLHINHLKTYNIENYLSMDINTRRNLELTENLREKNKKGSLLWVLDNTSTAMGGRELRKWIEEPLVSIDVINGRLDSVGELTASLMLRDNLKEGLKEIYDIERLVGKISSKSVNAKELIALKNSIGKVPYLRKLLEPCNSGLLKEYYDSLDELLDVFTLIDTSIIESPAISIKEGNIIKVGYNAEVDELKDAKLKGKQWLADLENREREITGIKSLKVSYNKVFGYYIEITRSNLASVPEDRYIRKQTLSNCERYITEELKNMEEKILGAEEKLTTLEYEIFTEIRDIIEKEIIRMQKTSKIIASIDVLLSFSKVAIDNKYVKPVMTKDGNLDIKNGRHPVVENLIQKGAFVSNDTLLSNEGNTMILITGPNMGGKSTYMRQNALMVIMAQIGSFVPAAEARISVCDKVFTRIGASDDLAGGKSTFMVEMWEVSNILNNATRNSLILLDEVGRGTSTYDGLSIAWAVIEYLTSNNNIRCKTLFATHYHELTSLEDKISGVVNYSVGAKKIGEDLVFLHKIMKGAADESYGIEVAKLAGLPSVVIKRANDILTHLEDGQKQVYEKSQADNIVDTKTTGIIEELIVSEKIVLSEKLVSNKKGKAKEIDNGLRQLDFMSYREDGLINELKNIDLMNLTPIDCMNKLNALINKAKGLA